MNKKARLMLVLLSAATMTAGVLGIAGCKSKKSDNSTKNVYAAYVEYTEKKGETPMDYDQWLATVKGELFIKGDTGATGAPGTPGQQGQPGTPGAPGSNGVSITEVKLSEDGKSLDIYYSNDKVDHVVLPEAVTHVHGYDDDSVVTLIPATEEAEGLGYKVCTDNNCDHIELVVISKRYIVTVKGLDGKAVENVTVVINGAKSVTNAEGVATVTGYGYKNDYVIAVEGKSTDQVYRTGNDPRVEMVVIDEYDTARDSNAQTYSAIKTAGVYPVTLNTTAGDENINDQEVLLVGGETEKYYKITPINAKINSADFAVLKVNKKSVLSDGSYSVIVYPGEQVKLCFNADTAVLTANGFVSGGVLNYCVKVEELEMPTPGTEANRINVELGKKVALTAGTTTYFRWNNTESSLREALFELSDGVTASFYQKDQDEDTYALFDAETPFAVEKQADGATTVQLGFDEDVGLFSGVYLFSVTAPASAVNPEFTFNTPVGTQTNPDTLTHGTKATADDDSTSTWYKYTSADGDKAISIVYTGDSLQIFDEQMQSVGKYTSSAYDTKLPAGTYYIELNGSSLLIKDYDSATEAKYTMAGAAAITPDFTSGSYSIDISGNATGVYAYYKFTAAKAGDLGHDGYGNPMYDGYTVNFYVNGSAASSCEEGDEVVVGIYRQRVQAASVSITLTKEGEEPGPDEPGPDDPTAEEKKFVFVFMDNSGVANLNGAHVAIKKGDTVIAEADVVYEVISDPMWGDEIHCYCDLQYVPGEYDIVITGGASSNYQLTGLKTSEFDTYGDLADEKGNVYPWNEDLGDYGDYDVPEGATTYYCKIITLSKMFQAKFKVVCEEDPTHEFKNLTVEVVADYRGENVVDTITIGEDGFSEIKNYALPDGQWYFRPVLSGSDAETYGLSDIHEGSSLNPHGFDYADPDYDNVNEFSIKVEKKNEYKVQVLSTTGAALPNVTVQLTQMYGGKKQVISEAQTDAYGKATLKAFVNQYTIEVVKDTIPAGYNVNPFTTDYNSAPEGEVVLQLAEGDKVVTGFGTASMLHQLNAGDGVDAFTIITGTNVVQNSDSEDFYRFNAPGSGTFKFTLTNAAQGYFSYIDYQSSSMWDAVKLVADGKQQIVGKDIVLGANRGLNKVYEFTVTLSYGDVLVIGFETGTGSGADAKIIVEEANVVKPTELTAGANQLTLANGSVSATYEMEDDYNNGVTFTWDESLDIVVTVDGEEVENGVQWEPQYGFTGTCGITVTSESISNGSVTITVTESELEGYGY